MTKEHECMTTFYNKRQKQHGLNRQTNYGLTTNRLNTVGNSPMARQGWRQDQKQYKGTCQNKQKHLKNVR